MNHLSKFYAISAIYFGLASAVGAQPASAPSGSPPASAVEGARQDEFQHPMLEQRSGHDMRTNGEQGPRIQRRGMQDTRRDGDMQRNVLPGASDADGDPTLEREARDRRQAPADRRRPN